MENNLIKNDLAVVEDGKIKRFTSLNTDEKEERIKLYNSLQKCDVKLNDIVGEELEIEGVYIEAREIGTHENEETGEILPDRKFRTILYGTNGITYVASAYGIYNSISQIIAIFGMPTKESPIKVKVEKRPTKDTSKTTLILSVIE